jgi:hypothetical protein
VSKYQVCSSRGISARICAARATSVKLNATVVSGKLKRFLPFAVTLKVVGTVGRVSGLALSRKAAKSFASFADATGPMNPSSPKN